MYLMSYKKEMSKMEEANNNRGKVANNVEAGSGLKLPTRVEWENDAVGVLADDGARWG